MKQLEDRIKDRLEGYESSLPEGDLADFRALLDAAAKTGKKRSPTYLAWLAPVAVAACLALFLVFGRQQDMIQVVDGSSLMADATPAVPAEIADLPEPEPLEGVAMLNEKPKKMDDSSSEVHFQSIPVEEEKDQQPVKSDTRGEENPKDNGTSADSSAGYSPFVPTASHAGKPVSMKVGQAAAKVVGGAGFVAAAGMLPMLLMKNDSYDVNSTFSDPGGDCTEPKPPVDRRTWDDVHHMPLRVGLSLRIPVSDRWSLTTGFDYSWYSSELEYSLSGTHYQNAHYLGIPVRADLTIARNRWMDVYVGAGGSVDFCIAAHDTGQKIARDGVGLSLIGAGGIQVNVTGNLGLYLDPALSLDLTSGNRTLETYRSEHPFMFAVSGGLRFTVPISR